MKKAQSYIIQFIIFFTVGFIVFLSIGSFFRMQSDYFIDELSYKNSKIAANYMSSLAISLVDSCKQCDYSRVRTSFESKYEFIIKAGKIWEIILPQERKHSFSLHNLNFSISSEGSVLSSKTITLTFDKTKNKLKVE
ncbi:MAG: hypothetical protein ACP5O8_00795 [Candidatus Aenigmatarchaeota archaeon]